MLHADLALARRLENTEGRACAAFVDARRKVFPESGAMWREIGGAIAAFDAADSPITQTFGLGVDSEISAEGLDALEQFFKERGAHTDHEVSPFAGTTGFTLLAERGYRPIEISNVLYQELGTPVTAIPQSIEISVAGAERAEEWTRISIEAWSHSHPEFEPFFRDFAAITAARTDALNFLAEIDGMPAAVGSLSIHDGVAQFAGAATLPEYRRKGLQSALIQARLEHAWSIGCKLASFVAQPGSNSHSNAEKHGFRVAYTRTKWRLARPA